jgi:ADP-ribose pyrophosphatase YjhB (NUDIX family)
MPFTYEYPRPAVTVDVVLFTIRAGELAVLMIRRGQAPFKGHWALPGGFVEPNESLERAAARELQEETGLVQTTLEQLGAFGDPGRDPRGHTVSVAFYAFLVVPGRPVAADDAADAQWVLLSSLQGKGRGVPRVAFDHARIIALARERLKEHLLDPARRGRLELVPARFTLSELQHVYEALLGRQLDKRNFRAKLLQQNLVEPVASAQRTGRHRPAQLYRWSDEEPSSVSREARVDQPPESARRTQAKAKPAPRSRNAAGKRVR